MMFVLNKWAQFYKIFSRFDKFTFLLYINFEDEHVITEIVLVFKQLRKILFQNLQPYSNSFLNSVNIFKPQIFYEVSIKFQISAEDSKWSLQVGKYQSIRHEN